MFIVACGIFLLWHANTYLWHVRSSSLTRDQSRASCIGSWSLSHRTTREVSSLTLSLAVTSKTLGRTIPLFRPSSSSVSHKCSSANIWEGTPGNAGRRLRKCGRRRERKSIGCLIPSHHCEADARWGKSGRLSRTSFSAKITLEEQVCLYTSSP